MPEGYKAKWRKSVTVLKKRKDLQRDSVKGDNPKAGSCLCDLETKSWHGNKANAKHCKPDIKLKDTESKTSAPECQSGTKRRCSLVEASSRNCKA